MIRHNWTDTNIMMFLLVEHVLQVHYIIHTKIWFHILYKKFAKETPNPEEKNGNATDFKSNREKKIPAENYNPESFPPAEPTLNPILLLRENVERARLLEQFQHRD